MSNMMFFPATGFIINSDLIRTLIPSFALTKKRTFEVVASQSGLEPPTSVIKTQYSLTSRWVLSWVNNEDEVKEDEINGENCLIGEKTEELQAFVSDFLGGPVEPTEENRKNAKLMAQKKRHDLWVDFAAKRIARVHALWNSHQSAGVPTVDAEIDTLDAAPSYEEQLDKLNNQTAELLDEGNDKREGLGILGTITSEFDPDWTQYADKLKEIGFEVSRQTFFDMINIPFQNVE
jgi:hypothetical protein